MRVKMFLTQVAFLMNNALFDEEYTVGQAGAIDWLRANVGTIICYAISAIGFLIVAAAIIRNALAGLYLAFPNMWDKVHDVRQAIEQGLTATGGGGSGGGEKFKKVAASMGSVLLSMLPDVKDATDFADESEGGKPGGESLKLKRKQWLTKSIPSFLALCMIGMAIYYGYPTKLANYVGETVRFGLDAIFENVDPVQAAKNIFEGINTYELATDSATNSLEKNVNALTRSAVKQVYTKYSDMQGQPLQETALEIETAILNVVGSCPELNEIMQEQGDYTVAFMAQLTATKPALSTSFDSVVVKDTANKTEETIENLFVAKSTSGVKQYKFQMRAKDLSTGSQKVGDNDWILVTVNATPMSQSIVNSSSIAWLQHKAALQFASSTDGNSHPLTLDGLNPSSKAANGIYTTDEGHVKITAVVNGSATAEFDGKLNIAGDKIQIIVSNTVKTAITNATELNVTLPRGTYTMYTTKRNDAEVTSKVTVSNYKLIIDSNSDANGWINRNWDDYSKPSVKPYEELNQSFFDAKKSADVVSDDKE